MFIDVFNNLCEQKGVTPNRACIDIGISRTSSAKWKNGGTPNGVTISKFAEYFNVTSDFLLEKEETKKTPLAPARDVSDSDIKFALFKGSDGITDEMYDEVKAFAEFVKQKYRKEKNPPK